MEKSYVSEAAVYTESEGISKYTFLISIYLISVLSSSVANFLSIDIQNLYRIPFVNIRWIDVAILAFIFSYYHKKNSQTFRLTNTSVLLVFCFSYIAFEAFQLARSWGLMDIPTQVSHFLSTLSLFVIIDLTTYALSVDKVIYYIEKLAVWGAATITISNLYLLYAFFTGRVVYTDFDVRVAIEVIGSKESVYAFILTSFVYGFSLYFLQQKISIWHRALFLLAIASILGAMIIQIFRGTLLMIMIITLYFIFSSATVKQTLVKIIALVTFTTLGYLLFGDALAKRGYDPIDKITEIVAFSVDVKDPNWDKGRAEAQGYAIRAWKENFWIGAGYDELASYGLPEDVVNPHNGIIQSLFHRGVAGTILLVLLLFLLFRYAAGLWLMLRGDSSYEGEVLKLLVFCSFLWIITFMTEEALWEKYSLSIEFMFLGFITNIYKQQVS